VKKGYQSCMMCIPYIELLLLLCCLCHLMPDGTLSFFSTFNAGECHFNLHTHFKFGIIERLFQGCMAVSSPTSYKNIAARQRTIRLGSSSVRIILGIASLNPRSDRQSPAVRRTLTALSFNALYK